MECLASPSSWDGDHSQWSGQYPGPRNVRAPWPVSAFSHCLYTFLNKGVSTLSWHHLSLRPLIGHCHSVQASHWLVVARLTPCLTSACQRDRPQSVTVFRHNLNEHLGPDSNLGNYWIYIPNTFQEYKMFPVVVMVFRKGRWRWWHNLPSSLSWLCDASLESGDLGSNFTIVTWAPGLFSHFAGPETTLPGHQQSWRVQSLSRAVITLSGVITQAQARHPGMLSALSKRLGVCHTLIWLSANNRAGVWSWSHTGPGSVSRPRSPDMPWCHLSPRDHCSAHQITTQHFLTDHECHTPSEQEVTLHLVSQLDT